MTSMALACSSASGNGPGGAPAPSKTEGVSGSAASGAPDASDATDAGPNGGASLCGASAIFCDGFEGSLSSWSQSYVQGGQVTIDTAHAFRGQSALRAHVDALSAGGATAAAMMQHVQSLPSHVFVRFFAYQPSPHPPSPANLLDVDQQGAPYAGIGLLTDPPSGALAMNTFNTGGKSGPVETWASGGATTSLGQWTCFELELDTVAQTSHLYMNGSEVVDLAHTDLGLPSLGIVGVGLSFYLASPQDAQDAWIDEVEVSGSRIGCTAGDAG
jgi:hypothetical protein